MITTLKVPASLQIKLPRSLGAKVGDTIELRIVRPKLKKRTRPETDAEFDARLESPEHRAHLDRVIERAKFGKSYSLAESKALIFGKNA